MCPFMHGGLMFAFPSQALRCFRHSVPLTEGGGDALSPLTLDQLANRMTSPDNRWGSPQKWKAHCKELRQTVGRSSASVEQLSHFFTSITQWGLRQDPLNALRAIPELATIPQLEAIGRWREQRGEEWNAAVLASESASSVPPLHVVSFRQWIWGKWRHLCLLVGQYSRDALDIVVGALNFLRPPRRFLTLWDRHLLIEIACKCLVIPYLVCQMLQPFFIMTATVYWVTAAVLVGSGLLLSAYQRWLRPPPHRLVNCTNLDEQISRGEVDQRIGQERELRQLMDALEGGSNVLLVGRSGEGKSALLQHFVQLKQAKQVPEQLRSLRVHTVRCGDILSNANFGRSELIGQMKSQLRGFESKTLLFFDEFDQVAESQSAVQEFKIAFLDESRKTKFVAATTYQAFERLKACDRDGSLMRRLVVIELKSPEEDVLRAILLNWLATHGNDVPVTADAIDAVIEITRHEREEESHIGRIAQCLRLLQQAVGRCRTTYTMPYESEQLVATRRAYRLAQQQCALVSIPQSAERRASMQALAERVRTLVAERQQIRERVAQMRILWQCQQATYRHYTSLTHQIVTSGERRLWRKERRDRITYLWYHYFALPAMRQTLQEQMAQLAPHCTVEVNRSLIEQLHRQFATPLAMQ